MDKKSTYIIVGIICIGLTLFLIALFSRSGLDVNNVPSGIASTTDWVNTLALPKEVLVTPKTTITAKHAYQNGTHTIAGEVPLPTACHLLEVTGSTSPDKKEIVVAFVSIIKTEEVCPENITPARFKVSIKALQKATTAATLNGQEITLNLIEAGPDENLDSFELYIKG